MAKRTNVRPVPGLPAQGSRPRGSAARLPNAKPTSQVTPGPSEFRNTQGTRGGGGVNTNSQPV